MRSRFVLVVVGVLLSSAGCGRASSPAPASEGSTAAAVGSGHRSADDAPAARAEGTGVGATEGSTRWAAEAAPEQLPDLVAVMRSVGFPESASADLADFVPVPPGAEGVAGTFVEGSTEVRVAVILYPNEQYARPHVTDVEQRLRVVPGTPEAVRRSGTMVVHVRAADPARATEVADGVAAQLGWGASRR